MNIPEEVKVAIQQLHADGVVDRDECLQRLGSGSYEGAWSNDISAEDWPQFVADCVFTVPVDKEPEAPQEPAEDLNDTPETPAPTNVVTTEVKLDQPAKPRGRPKKDLTSKE